MYWHIDTDIVSLAVLCVLYVNAAVSKNDGYEQRNKRFVRCLQAGIVITVIDIAASVIMEIPVNRYVYHSLMSLYFTAVQAVIVEWFMYAITILYQNDKKGAKLVTMAIMSGYVAYALFAAANPWTGLVYSLGPNGEYSRGPLFMMMVAVYAIYVLALFALVIVRWKHIPKGYPGLVLLLVPIIQAVGIAVQLLNPGWLMILPAYMLCMLLTSQFLQNVSSRDNKVLLQRLSKAAVTDPLTGIYNRAGAENLLNAMEQEDAGKNCLVVMVDIDDLKGINDRMGHAQGDRAIKFVADKLGECFGPGDIVSRYGGDEFLAYMPGDMSETQYHAFLRNLVEQLSQIRVGEDDDVPLHGSIGATMGRVGVDHFSGLCAQADIALYHVKRNGKNSYAFYRKEMDMESRGCNIEENESVS